MGTFVVVTRGTAVATAGVYISAVSYALLLYSFLDLGTGPNLVREAADGDHRTRITHYFWTRIAVTAAVVAVGAVGVVILFPSSARTAGFISLIYVAASINGVAAPIGQVIGDARAFRVLTLVQGLAVFMAVAGCVLLISEPSANVLVAAYSLGGAISSLAALVWVRKHMERIPARELPKAIREQLRAVMMLAVATGAGSIYLRIDQSIVLKLRGALDAAYYGLASRIAVQARLVPSALQLSVSTFLAKRVRGDGVLALADQLALARVSLGTGVGLAFGVIAVSDAAVLAIAGSSYADAITPTIVLGASLLSTSYNYVVGTSAIMGGRDRAFLVVTIAALTFNIAANVLLVPSHGILAAALVASLTETFAAVAIAELVGVERGAVRRRYFGAALLGTVAVALAKLYLVEASTLINVAGSLLILGIGLAALAIAFRALRGLSDDPVAVEIGRIERASEGV
ncbi:MAG: oligosaccharide flippase family protein [Thermoleophilaceae bacterium]|nr:oligosaccharide flippase family protein [Thermoleophilaceae bacterium]